MFVFDRSTDSHLWLNRVRKANSTAWLNDLECGSNEFFDQPVYGNNISITQCLALNMTSPYNEDHVLFAAPCEQKMGFICAFSKGHYSGDLLYLWELIVLLYCAYHNNPLKILKMHMKDSWHIGVHIMRIRMSFRYCLYKIEKYNISCSLCEQIWKQNVKNTFVSL